jgi:hypothetical protein
MYEKARKLVLYLHFLKLPGTAEEAPYVNVVIQCGMWRSPPIKMRIDTGADMSVIPGDALRCAQPKDPVQVRSYGGTVRLEYTYDVILAIVDNAGHEMWQEHPFRGVLASRNRDCGLLGMDILKHFRLVMENQCITLERIEDEEETQE